MEEREIGEEDKPVKGAGRDALQMEDGKMYKVVIRGLGEYFGGEKKLMEGMDESKFEPGRIKNVGLVVCDPESSDPETEMMISKSATTIVGKAMATHFGQRDEEGILWLREEEYLNAEGWIGFKNIKPAGKENARGYEKLYWSPEGINTDFPGSFAFVGAAQREEYGVEGKESDEVDID